MMPTKVVRGIPPENLNPEELIKWKEREPTQDELDKAVSKITEVYSHHQGLAQCENFLRNNLPKASKREAWDTAGAARDLKRDVDSTQAAISSKEATRYNMTIIKENIEDDPDNTTRFLLLAKKPLTSQKIQQKEEEGFDIITTLMFQTPNTAGSLVSALDIFRKHEINLTKLETYMMGEKHSEPHFYVDVLFNPETKKGQEVLKELFEVTIEYKDLGTYPASKMR
jgi:prephenate dehydratase